MPGKRGVSKLVLLLAAAAVVHWLCRLTDEGRMLHGDVRQLGARKDRFEVGAVAGDMLYLTSFQSPLYGALLAVNLLEDEEPKVCSAEPATMCLACPVLRAVQDQACLDTLSAIVLFAYLVPGYIPNVILSV